RDLVSYSPMEVTVGDHSVVLEAKDIYGNPFQPIQWNFTAVKKKGIIEKGIKNKGKGYAESKTDEIKGERQTINRVNATINGEVAWIDFNGRLYLTSKESKNTQPRNRFYLGAGTSWMRLNLGDVNPRLNNISMWGKRIRGAEGILNLGFVNLHIVQGESERGIEGTAAYDSVENRMKITKSGTFKRRIFGIRPSFGGGKRFQLGFSYIHARDDTASIKYGKNPQDNLVLGSDIMLGFNNRRIVIEAGVAFSLVARDISGGAVTKAELDTLFDEDKDGKIKGKDIPIDPADYDKYFILNQSILPLDPTGLTSLAYSLRVKFNYFNNYVTVKFRSIGPEFNSFANPFIRKDIRGIEISDRIRLFQNKLFIILGFENTNNNLAGNKPATTNNKSLTTGISLYPGPGLPTINLNVKNYTRDNGITEIETQIGQIIDNRENNSTVTSIFSINYDVEFLNLKHNLGINIVNSERTDEYKGTRLPDYTSSEMSSRLISFSLRTNYNFPLVTNVSYSTNKNRAAGVAEAYKFDLFSANGEYRMFNEKLRLRGGLKSSFGKGAVDFTELNYNLGVRYDITRKHSLSFSGSLISLDEEGTKYLDKILNLRYTLSF
ncbi:MAG: hypothetical protein ACE5QV_07320, partial [Fidelibacterota bacterium]